MSDLCRECHDEAPAKPGADLCRWCELEHYEQIAAAHRKAAALTAEYEQRIFDQEEAA